MKLRLRLSIALVLLLAVSVVIAAQSRIKPLDAVPALPPAPLPSDALFDDTVVHDIYLTVNSRDWQSLKDHYLDNTYYPANFRWRDQTFRNVGIRSRGHTSRSPVKPSLRVDFNRYITDGEFLGLSAIVLRNNSQDASGLHERLSMLLFNRMAAPYEREAHARLFINNEFSGLYSLVEEADHNLAQRLFNEDAGNVYEYKYEEGDPPHYLEDQGSDPALYVPKPWDPKTHETNPHPEVIAELIRTINQDSDAVFRSTLPAHVDVVNLITHMAIEMFIGDLDGFHGQFAPNNFDAYRFANSNILKFFPWDKSQAYTGGPLLTIWHQLLDVPAEKRNHLSMRVLGLSDLKSQLLDTLIAVANSASDLDKSNPADRRGWMEREIEREYTQIKDFSAVAPQDLSFYSKADFEAAVESLRDFARRRPDFVRGEVAAAR
jgi:hypothetical protein